MAENGTFDIVDELDEPSERATTGNPEPESGVDGETGTTEGTPKYRTVSPFEFSESRTAPESRAAEPSTRTEPGFTTVSSASSGPGERPRRGRPPGSVNREKTSPTVQSSLSEGLEELLLGVHFMGAAILSAPHWELQKDEAHRLAASVREVGKHYDFPLDPKKLALIRLGATVTGIYAPRVIQSWNGAPKQVRPRATVTEMPRPKVEPEPKTMKPNDDQRVVQEHMQMGVTDHGGEIN